jgi:hypothetical protein
MASDRPLKDPVHGAGIGRYVKKGVRYRTHGANKFRGVVLVKDSGGRVTRVEDLGREPRTGKYSVAFKKMTGTNIGFEANIRRIKEIIDLRSQEEQAREPILVGSTVHFIDLGLSNTSAADPPLAVNLLPEQEDASEDEETWMAAAAFLESVRTEAGNASDAATELGRFFRGESRGVG